MKFIQQVAQELREAEGPEACPHCAGSGMGPTDESKCHDCDGTGVEGEAIRRATARAIYEEERADREDEWDALNEAKRRDDFGPAND